MTARPGRAPQPAPPPLTGLLWVVALCFVLPVALLVHLAGTTGSTRLAGHILALTLPATGALILRLNPDLLPDRAALATLGPLGWLRIALLAALLGFGAWWVARLVPVE